MDKPRSPESNPHPTLPEMLSRAKTECVRATRSLLDYGRENIGASAHPLDVLYLTQLCSHFARMTALSGARDDEGLRYLYDNLLHVRALAQINEDKLLAGHLALASFYTYLHASRLDPVASVRAFSELDDVLKSQYHQAVASVTLSDALLHYHALMNVLGACAETDIQPDSFMRYCYEGSIPDVLAISNFRPPQRQPDYLSTPQPDLAPHRELEIANVLSDEFIKSMAANSVRGVRTQAAKDRLLQRIIATASNREVAYAATVYMDSSGQPNPELMRRLDMLLDDDAYNDPTREHIFIYRITTLVERGQVTVQDAIAHINQVASQIMEPFANQPDPPPASDAAEYIENIQRGPELKIHMINSLLSTIVRQYIRKGDFASAGIALGHIQPSEITVYFNFDCLHEAKSIDDFYSLAASYLPLEALRHAQPNMACLFAMAEAAIEDKSDGFLDALQGIIPANAKMDDDHNIAYILCSGHQFSKRLTTEQDAIQRAFSEVLEQLRTHYQKQERNLAAFLQKTETISMDLIQNGSAQELQRVTRHSFASMKVDGGYQLSRFGVFVAGLET